jgi:hypothetical protein
VARSGACALVLLTLVTLTAPTTSAATSPKCNGAAILCERRLDEVAFATTHNSMASTADGFVPPNQRRSIRAQLAHGIRAFQIDAFFGTSRDGRVYTDLSGLLGHAT